MAKRLNRKLTVRQANISRNNMNTKTWKWKPNGKVKSGSAAGQKGPQAENVTRNPTQERISLPEVGKCFQYFH
jgi:hypothetical protein